MPSNQCTYTNLQGHQICPHPPRPESSLNLCIFHDPAEKKEEEIQKLLKEKLQKADFNFEGYIFTGPCSFREAVFPEFANFENCQFLGRETSFYRASFKKGAVFNNVVFRGGKVNFSRAQFGGDFNLFNGASFENSETNFFETVFLGKHIGFASAKFGGHLLNFKEAEFRGTVFFNQCHFSSTLVSFEKVKMAGALVSFSHSAFTGRELLWTEAQLALPQIDFSHSRFENDLCHFERAHFQGEKILFSETTFQCRNLSFLQASFEFQQLSFSYSFFNCREVDFSEVRLKGNLSDFSNCTFQGKSLKCYPLILENETTDFSRSEFGSDEKTIYIENPNQKDLSFLGVFFHGGKTKLKGDLHAASFLDTSLDNVDLHEGRWNRIGGRFVCRDEMDANLAETPSHYLKAEEVCRNIKRCYEGYGDYEIAGDFYYGEMECKRKQSAKKRWGGLQLMRLTSGYGISPVRVVLTSLFIIFLFAFFYLFGGIETPHGAVARSIGFELSQLKSTVMDYFSCLYFSFSMFLGFGDYRPMGWSRAAGASEAFFGAFFIALFVLSVGKKMNW